MSMQRILDLLNQRIGLDAESIGPETVATAVRRRMEDVGETGLTAFFLRIEGSDAELTRLVEEVVVCETWFFRDSEPFIHLMRFARDTWPKDRVFRVLSAPCSSGEEPYSIAMALLEAGLPAQDFAIDAVDISERALNKAELGVYTKNSFRREQLDFRDKYFSSQGKGFKVRDHVKSLVSFQPGNLALDFFESSAGPYDVVFCRNFLIYLDKDAKNRVAKELHRLLRPDGLLVVGHAEAAAMLAGPYTPVRHPRSFSFRPSNGATVMEFTTPNQPEPPPVDWDMTLLRQVRSRMTWARKATQAAFQEPRAVEAQEAPIAEVSAQGLAQCRGLADQGRLADALAACEELLEQDMMNTEGHHLAGVILHALGEEEAAERALSRAVYLDPHHQEALAQLALIRANAGDEVGARRYKDRADRALSRREGDVEVAR
ncbi:MAG: methyltransferase [Desulfovibrio sp.]|nr:MAG: methyltransferase [Desulfovibrio sp.]